MRAVIQHYREAFQGLPREAWLLSIVLLVNRAGTMVLPFLSLYATQDLGLGVEVAGMVLGAWGVGALSGAFVGGWLCDVVGPLRLQFAALAGAGVGFLAMEHVTNPWWLAVCVALTGTCAEAFRPANSAALAAFTPDELQPRAVALNRLAVNLGFSLAPAIGGPLAAWSYSWLFRIDGATCLLSALLLRHLFRHVFHRGPLQTTADAERTPSGREDLHPMQDVLFLVFLALFIPAVMTMFQVFGVYPVYLKEVFGIEEARFGLLMSGNAVLILCFEMVLTRWMEERNAIRVTGLGALLLGAGFAILPFGPGLGVAILSLIVWTTGEMLSVPFSGGWIARRAGRRHRGKYMGLYTASWGVAFMAGPPLGASVYARFGPDALWWGAGVLGVLNGAAYLLLASWETRKNGPAGNAP
ncbi:MAG: MFS transporter [Thermoanaerobaculia bacterium]|nr:MFS transporter [Thermoanaerobaculia bacterium]